jgi:prepilin-type N-terminal cleavage/methylation domain-containing protein
MSDRADKLHVGEHAVRRREAGFTLLEVLTALAILALASSSVLLVIDRCLASASDLALRMEAFDLVRDNMEKILCLDAVAESVDFGTSEKYSGISWQTVVEGFSEPISGQMWARAICSADYLDSRGEKQKVELVRWLTPLTDQQAGQLATQQDLDKLEAEQALKTDEDAAAYARIDTDTLRQWGADGLVKTQDGMYLRYNLDVFVKSQGKPTPEEKAQQVTSIQDLALRQKVEMKEMEQNGALGILPGTDGKSGPAGLPSPNAQKTNAAPSKDSASGTR